jgi:hypothetical protein
MDGRDGTPDCRVDRPPVTEASGWDQAPTYLLRDRDQVYGQVFTRRMRAMGIRDRPTSPRSPWQNAYADRLDPTGMRRS